MKINQMIRDFEKYFIVQRTIMSTQEWEISKDIPFACEVDVVSILSV